MNRNAKKAGIVAGLVLVLAGVPRSWAQSTNEGCNSFPSLFFVLHPFTTSCGWQAFGSQLNPNPTNPSPRNTALGAFALASTNGGSDNSATGYAALHKNTTGTFNTATGFAALYANTTGNNNTASGTVALYANTTGNYNTASGYGALYFNTTGTFNIANGYAALYANTTGNNNTATGVAALSSNTTGSDNLAVGNLAGINLVSGNDNIYLGAAAKTANESNTMRLGNPEAQFSTFIAGVATTAIASGLPVVITASGQLGVQSSSARYKWDIQDLGPRSQGLHKLRPVSFRYTTAPQGPLQYGLIAEEVAQVYPDLVVRSTDGTIEGVEYQKLIPLLLNELQHQQQELTEVRAQNESLRAVLGQMQTLAARVARLEETQEHPILTSR